MSDYHYMRHIEVDGEIWRIEAYLIEGQGIDGWMTLLLTYRGLGSYRVHDIILER